MYRDSESELDKIFMSYNKILSRFKSFNIKTKNGKDITHKDLRKAISVMIKKHPTCFAERRDLIVELLELLDKNRISDEDKKTIYNVVMSMNNKTEKQKDRFARYFGIKPNNLKRESMTNIAKSYGCTPSAIRSSVISVKAGLYRIPKENFLILKEVYDKYLS